MEYYYNPVKTYIGEGSLKNLSEIIESVRVVNNSAVLLHRGGEFLKTHEYNVIMSNLKNYAVTNLVFTRSNPDMGDITNLLLKLKGIDYSLIIGVGGGSIMDISKALKILKNANVSDRNMLRDILTERKYMDYPENNCKLIAVPTTTGTGSEVTPFASIWDKEERKKYSLYGDSVYADAAIIDGTLVKNLPDAIAISTGLDSLCHAVEAYWARSSNSISRMYALKAIKLITSNVIEITAEPNNAKIKKNLLMGSFFAGLAFSNTKTTSCHSISYPLTMMFKIPHGIAAFLTLGKMYEINKESLIDSERLYAAFGTEDIPEKINTIFKAVGISSKLSDYGVKSEDIDELLDKSFTKGRMDNNPVVINKETLRKVFKEIL